jgi:preprotein translocase subunit SecA
MREQTIADLIARCIPENAYAEQWDAAGLHEESRRLFALDLPIADWVKEEGIADAEIRDRVHAAAERRMAEKAANVGPDVMRMVEKSLLLQILDQIWKDHLHSLDHLRQGISLRAYGQRDPLNEYKREAFTLFDEMLTRLRERVMEVLSHVELQRAAAQTEDDLFPSQPPSALQETRRDPAFAELDGPPSLQQAAEVMGQRHLSGFAINPNDHSTWGKVQRNQPCPCGSGLKYKHCHGKMV